MDSAQGPVVGVADQPGQIFGGLEVLVDYRAAEAASADVAVLATAAEHWNEFTVERLEAQFDGRPTTLELLVDVAPRPPWE